MASFINSLNSTQKYNLDVIIQTFKDQGVTNVYSIAAVCAIVSKESTFKLVRENMNYSAKRLQQVFSLDSSKANSIANNPQKIANWVYGATPNGKRTVANAYGNTGPDDGWKYRGGGFNQLTFKGNYDKYAKIVGINIGSNPDAIDNPKDMSKVLYSYYKTNIPLVVKNYNSNGINGFKDLENAIFAFYHATAGPGKSASYVKGLKNNDSLGGMTKALKRGPELLEYVKQFSGLSEPPGGMGMSDTSSSIDTTEYTGFPVAPKQIKASITLEKVSGPGEIIGSTTVDVWQAESVFREIQFDMPGEYVIRATANKPGIEPLEFKMTIGQMPLTQEEKAKKEEEVVNGTRPIITQIDKPTYLLKPIEMPVPDDQQQTLEYAQGLGFTPFLWYNGVQVNMEDIKSLTLYHEGVVPCCAVNFVDSTGFMSKRGMPLDDTNFEIFLNSGSTSLKSIHMRFKLTNFQENQKKSYTITGSIDLKDFYKINYKPYTGTSFEVLRELSKELQLGFNSNIENTTDSMKWLNPGMMPRQFMGDIVKHSYISDTSFVMGYIDFYYCFNYVDLEKEWNRDISNDVGVVSSGIGQMQKDATDEDKIERLILTNDKSQGPSNMFFRDHKMLNNATQKAISKGQFTVVKYYDVSSKSELIFDINSLTSTDDKKVILKGKPADDKELKTNYRTIWGGKIDMSNVHQNYLYADVLNIINFDNLTKITAELEMTNANFNLYKFQKVKIIFSKVAPKLTDESDFTMRLSGEWIITGIEYNWVKGSLTQKIEVVRKELEKLPEEMEEQKSTSEPETKQGNENPVVAPTPPNKAYQVDEFYTVKDKNGKVFTIEITEILDNGNEVKGYTTELPKENPVPSKPPTTEPGSTAPGTTPADSESTTETTDSQISASAPVEETPEQQMVTIKKRLGVYAIEEKLADGSKHITVYIDNKTKFIRFFNNGRFFYNSVTTGENISKGNYYKDARKLIVSEGKHNGETLETDNFWDTLKKLKK